MPTPVSAARPCLAADSAAALDAAVSAARRRSHTQTSTLHVIFALLSPATPSLLRDAAARARPSRLHPRALELCFTLALDRLPSSHHYPPPNPADDPPVSNSLMAAIRRSQAHQRRNLDVYNLYQCASSPSAVKVELQQLVLAILDDPQVSHVFRDAGFRSCDVKLAILSPPPRPPPGFPFPFPSHDGAEENRRRVAETLVGGRNPILVGAGASQAADDFTDAVQKRNWPALPAELRGVRIVDLGEAAELSKELGGKVVVEIGDLKRLVESLEGDGGLISELTTAMELHGGRMGVMGWSEGYEAYAKFLARHPSLEKDWNLQMIPITTARGAASGSLSLMESFVPFGGFFLDTYEFKNPLGKLPQSVVRCQQCDDKYEQEVAVILKDCPTSVEGQHQRNVPAWMQKDNLASMKDGLNLTEAKVDNTPIVSARVADLQKKWNDNCERLHLGCQMRGVDNCQVPPHIASIPYVPDEDRDSNQIGKNPDVAQNQSRSGSVFSVELGLQQISKGKQHISLPSVSEPKGKDLVPKLQLGSSRREQIQANCFRTNQDVLSEMGMLGDHASPSSATTVATDLVLGTRDMPLCREEHPASVTHMEHLVELSEHVPLEKGVAFQKNIPEFPVQSYPCSASPASLLRNKFRPGPTLSGPKFTSCGVSTYDQPCPSSSTSGKFDPKDYKSLYTGLVKKVGRQEEAMHAISEAICRYKIGHDRHRGASLRGDVWLSFLGSDRVGKKRTALALAELIYGSKDSLIYIDLGYQDDLNRSNTICAQQEIKEFDAIFRWKTIVDHIAEEVGKNPCSVIFLESINKADLLVQSSLSQAIQTGKISDSRGRKFNINNSIFLVSSKEIQGDTLSPRKECIKFSEEMILGAQGWQMKILLVSDPEAADNNRNANVAITKGYHGNRQLPLCSVIVSKRKLDFSSDCTEQHGPAQKRPNTFLDLNLPVEEVATSDAGCSSDDENTPDNSEAWIEEFLNLVDGTVKFKPFKFDALAETVLKQISNSFLNTIGSGCVLELDVQVMEQILAAAWLSGSIGELNNWVEKVLARSFIELRQRHKISKTSILRLVACEGAAMDPATGILLPCRINVE